MLKQFTIVLCAVSLNAGVSASQEPIVPQRLPLKEALSLAFDRNPTLAAVRTEIDVAQANQLDVSRRLNPALTIESAGYGPGRREAPSFLNNQELSFRFDQEIEFGGRRSLRIAAAEKGIAAATAQVDNARRLLALDVQRAYFQAVLATADRDVARASIDEIDRAISLNRARFEKGEISGGELRRVQVERLRFVDDVFAAELALRNAKSALLALMNVTDLAASFEVVEPLAAGSVAATATAPGVIAAVLPGNIGGQGTTLAAEAILRRPDVLAAQREVERADTETRLQRALRSPNLTLGAGYKRDFGSNGLIIGGTLPLPFFNRNQGGVARAAAERAQAGHRARIAELSVRLDVQQAANAVDVNRERVAYIEREYLTMARESRDIVLASYRLGAANLIDFLDAQRAFRETVRTYNRALYEHRISIFELAAAASLPQQQ